jgi:iron(III) transport system substrate-binding protein
MQHSLFSKKLLISLFMMIQNPAMATQQSTTLNIFTTRHYDSDIQQAKVFEAKTKIKVNVVQIKEASQLIARVSEEKEKTQADLIITADVGNLWRAAEAGLFRPIGSAEIKKVVPADYRDSADLWTGLAVRARVIAFNKTKVKAEQIARMENLSAGEFKGRLLVRSSNHVYNQSLAASILAVSGKEGLLAWTRGVAANLARKPQGGDTDQIKAIASGEGDIAIVNSYYMARLMVSENPAERELLKNIGIVFPNQSDRGAHINVSGGGITRHAKNPESAKLFLEFLVSKEGQEIFTSSTREYPVRKDAPVPEILRSFGTPKFDVKAIKSIGHFTPEAVRILDEAGWR